MKLHPVSKQLLRLVFHVCFPPVFRDSFHPMSMCSEMLNCRGDLEFCLFGSGSRDEHRFWWWTKSYPSGRIMATSTYFFPPPLTYLTLPQKLAGFTVVGLIEGNGCFKPNKPWWKCRQFHERIPLNLDRTMIYPSWESKGQCHAPPKRHFNQPSWSQQKHLNKAFLGLALELFPWISDNHTQQMMLKGCSL